MSWKQGMLLSNALKESIRIIHRASWSRIMVAFTWGTSPANAVYNAKVLEQCAKMAFISFAINPETTMNPLLIEKHYSRKHGPNAYYGQKK